MLIGNSFGSKNVQISQRFFFSPPLLFSEPNPLCKKYYTWQKCRRCFITVWCHSSQGSGRYLVPRKKLFKRQNLGLSWSPALVAPLRHQCPIPGERHDTSPSVADRCGLMADRQTRGVKVNKEHSEELESRSYMQSMCHSEGSITQAAA